MKNCVLIYDDNEEILFLCKAILERENYRVETYTFCDNVISDIELHHPGIIFMDLWIPIMGGEKATLLIKSKPAFVHIPVILFSANSRLKEITMAVKADGYLEKPFDIALLKKTIEKYIL